MKHPFRMPTRKDMDSFRRGEEAFKRGAALTDNPMTDDDAALLWGFGWQSAQADKKKHHGAPPSNPTDAPKDTSSPWAIAHAAVATPSPVPATEPEPPFPDVQAMAEYTTMQIAMAEITAAATETATPLTDALCDEIGYPCDEWQNHARDLERRLTIMNAERDALFRHPDISECAKGHRFRTIGSHPAKSEREWECPHCAVAERDTALRELAELRLAQDRQTPRTECP